MSHRSRLTHNTLQSQHFDQHTQAFRQPIPAEIEAKTREIVLAARVHESSRVCDVGTGLGVLIGHLLDIGVQPENIIGCDLSSNMLREARLRFPGVEFWQGDFLDLPDRFGLFHAICFNACFGNIFDQTAAVKKAAAHLNSRGRIIISHPLGPDFQAGLHQADPEIVPHLLPSQAALQALAYQFKLEIETFRRQPDFYLAVLIGTH